MEAVWNANPNVNMMFCFEDGNCFIKRNEAASYAKESGKSYTVKMRKEEVKVKEEVKPTNKTNKK
jgi:hypothetical protein